jgi:hypothetical protein
MNEYTVAIDVTQVALEWGRVENYAFFGDIFNFLSASDWVRGPSSIPGCRKFHSWPVEYTTASENHITRPNSHVQHVSGENLRLKMNI